MKFFQYIARKVPHLLTRSKPNLPRSKHQTNWEKLIKGQGSHLLKGWNVPWNLDITFGSVLAFELCSAGMRLMRSCCLTYCMKNGITSLDPGVFYGLQLVISGFDTGMKATVLYWLCRFHRPIPQDLLYWRVSSSLLLYGLVGFALFGGAACAFPSHLISFKHPEDPSVRRVMLRFCSDLSIISSLLHVNLSGFTEELMYRGFLLATLSKWVATPTALLLSSVAFGLAHVIGSGHIEWPSFPQHFLFGIAVGAVYIHSKNLCAPIIVHCCYNTAVFVQCLCEFKKVYPNGFYEEVVLKQVK